MSLVTGEDHWPEKQLPDELARAAILERQRPGFVEVDIESRPRAQMHQVWPPEVLQKWLADGYINGVYNG